MCSLPQTEINAGFRFEPDLTVSEWADQYRVLSQGASAEPGKFKTSRTPYLKAIMDALSPVSPIKSIVFMKGAQVGGTESGNNWIGFVIDQAPGPMLVVQPTVDLAKKWSKGRLAALIADTPCLREKVKNPRSRDSGNTVQSKEFQGGQIVVTGANSAVGLRSMPVRYLFLDEISAYPHNADSEGDPVMLAVQRTSTFARKKIFMVSTPQIQGTCRIEKAFEQSNKQYYYVPCPHCHFYQVLKWPQIKWDNDPALAYYQCIECQQKIAHHHKTQMLAQGEWRAENPQNTKVAGFHLSSLYSPVGWLSWGQAAENYVQAEGDDELMQAWVNTTLGETWAEKGEAPDWQRLFERRELYTQGTVPLGGLVLTAGVDVQKDRLEVEVVAWGQNRESWSVDYRVIDGGPGTAKPWQQLSQLLTTTYPGDDGLERPITMMAVDAGYATQEVYNWVRSQPMGKVMAVKGSDKALVALGSPSRVDIMINGRKMRRGAKLWPVGVSMLKSEFYSALNLAQDENGFPAGYCHFPYYGPEYFKQLTAEQLVTKTLKGYQKREWQKMRDRNEALDCRIYARAAAIAIGVDRWREQQWQRVSGSKKPMLQTITEENAISPQKLQQPQRRVIRSAWLG